MLPREQLVLPVVASTILVATFAAPALLFFGIKRWVIRRGWQDEVKAIGLGASAVYFGACWAWMGLPWRDGGWSIVVIFVGTAAYSAGYARLARMGRRQRATGPVPSQLAASVTGGGEGAE